MAANRRADEDRTWAQVDREKRIDRIVRRVTIAAWAVTFLLVLLFVGVAAVAVVPFARAALAGQLPWSVVAGSAFPVVIVAGMLSVLIATLGTIAVFLRLRTATLTEIQLRLAALEQILASHGDGPESEPPRR